MNDGKKYLISLGLNEKDLRDIENRMTTTLSTAMENGMSLDRSGKAVVKKDMEILLGYVKELTSSISSATPDVAKQLTGNLKNVLPMIAGLADKMKQVNASTDWMKQGFTFGEDIYTTIKALDTVQKDVADVRAEISELTTSLNPFLNALKANDPSAFFKKFGDGFQSVSSDASTMRATITKELKAIESSGSGLKNLMKDIKASSRNFVDVKSAEEALNIFTSLQSKIENYEDLAGSFGKGIAIEHDIEEVKDYAKALVELQNLSKNKFAKNLFDVKGSTMFTDDIKAELQEITQSIAATIKQAGDTLQRTVDGLNLKEVQLSVVLPDADAKKIEKQANAWIEKFNEKFKTKPIQLSVDMADPFKTYKAKDGKLTKKQRDLAEQAKTLALESLRKISDDETLEANFSGLDDPETSKILRKLAESFDKIRKGVELGQTSILEATKQWRAEIDKFLTLSFKWQKINVGDGAQQLLDDLQHIMDDTPMQINVDTKDFITRIEDAFKKAQFNINGNITGSASVSGGTPIILTGTPIINNPPEQNTLSQPQKTPPPQSKPVEQPKSEDATPSAAEIVAKPANALTRAVEKLDAEINSLKDKKRLGYESVEQKKAAKANADANIASYNAEKATADEARKLVLDILIEAAQAAKNADIKEYNSTSKDERIAVLESRKNKIDKIIQQQEDPSKLVVDAVNKFYQNNDRQADRRLREIALIDKDLSSKYAEVIKLEKEISKLNPATEGNKISELRGKIEAIKPEVDMLFGGVTESVVAEYVALEKQIEKAKQRYAQTNSSDDKLALDGLEKRQKEIQSGLSYLQDTKGVDKAFAQKFEEAANVEREIMSLDPIKDKSKISDLKIQLKKIVDEMGNIFQGLKEKTTKELEDIETQLTEARKKYTLSNSAQDKKLVDQLEAKQKKLTTGRDAVQYLENNRIKKQLFEQSGFRDYSGLDVNTAIQFVNEILKGSTTLADTLMNLNANGVNIKGNILDDLVYFIPRVQEMMGIVSQSSQQWEQTDELKQRFLRIADLLQQISGLFAIRGSNATVESLQEFINVFGKVPTLKPVVDAAKAHLNSLMELSGHIGDDELYKTILGGQNADTKLFKLMQSKYTELPDGIQKELQKAIPSLDFSKLNDKDIDDDLRQAITDKLTTAFKSGGLDSNVFEQLKSGAPALQKFYEVLKLIVLYANQIQTNKDLYKLTGAPKTGYIGKLQGQIEKGDAMVATVGSGASQRTYGLQNKYNNSRHPIPGVNRNLNYDSSSFLSSLGVDKLEYEKFILSQGLFAEKEKLQNEIRAIIEKEDAAVAEIMARSQRARLNAIEEMLKKSGTTATSEAEAKARIKEINEQMFANMSLSSPRDMVKQEYGYDQTTYAQTAKKLADKVRAQEKATPQVREKLQKEIDELTAILSNREVILEAVRALHHDKELAQLNASVADDAAQKWKGYRSTKYQHKTTLSNLFNKTVGEYTDENGNVWDMSEVRKRFTTALQYGTMQPDVINPLLPLLDNYEDALAELRNMPEDAQANKAQLAIKDGLKAKLSVLKDTILNIYYEAEGWLLNDIFTSKIQSIETQSKAANQGVLSDHSGVEAHYKGLKEAEESRYATQRSQIESKYADQIDMSGGMSEIRSAYEQERRQIVSDKYNEKIRIFKKAQEEELKAFENEINSKVREPYAKYKEAKAEYKKNETKETEAKFKEAEKAYTVVKSQGNIDLLDFKKRQEEMLAKAKIDNWNEANSEIPNELTSLEQAARDAANQTVEGVATAKKEALRQSLTKRVESGELSESGANKELEQGITDINNQVQNGAIKGAITRARNKANKAFENFLRGIIEKYGLTADLTEKILAESIVKGDESAKQAELKTALAEHNAKMSEIEARRVAAVKEQQEKNAAAIKANMEQQQADMAKAAAELQSSNGHWMSDNTILRQIGSGERTGAVKDKIDANAHVKKIDDDIKNLMEQGRLTQGMVDGTEQLGELQKQQTEAMRTNATEIEKQTGIAQQSAESTQSQQQYYTGGFVGGGVAINTNGLAQETTLRGIWQLLNGGPPQGGWGDIQGIVARTVDELLPGEKAFASSMASVFKAYEGIDYETAAAIGKGGLIGKLQQGNARSVDDKAWDAALAQAVKEEVLALLHNHPNKWNALTWQDIDSGLYKANHGKQVKVSGSVGDRAITSIDFTGIDDETGAKIIERYREYLNRLAEQMPTMFGWKDEEHTNFAIDTNAIKDPEIKAGLENMVNAALRMALGDFGHADAFKQFNLSDMQGFMQSIVKPVQQATELVSDEDVDALNTMLDARLGGKTKRFATTPVQQPVEPVPTQTAEQVVQQTVPTDPVDVPVEPVVDVSEMMSKGMQGRIDRANALSQAGIKVRRDDLIRNGDDAFKAILSGDKTTDIIDKYIWPTLRQQLLDAGYKDTDQFNNVLKDINAKSVWSHRGRSNNSPIGSWLHFGAQSSKDSNLGQGDVNLKAYATFKDISKLTVEWFNGLLSKLTAQGYRGQIKIPKDLTGFYSSDQLVGHAEDAKSLKILADVLNQYSSIGDLSNINFGVDATDKTKVLLGRKGVGGGSFSQLLEEIYGVAPGETFTVDEIKAIIKTAIADKSGKHDKELFDPIVKDVIAKRTTSTQPAQEAAGKVAENIVQAGAQAAVESVTPAEITPNPNAKPAPAKKTAAEDVMDALRAGYKSDPKFAEIEGEKLLYDALGKINSFSNSKDKTSDQALRNMGNAYVKLKEVLNTKIVEHLGSDMKSKIESITTAAKQVLDANGVEIGKDLKGEVITPELLPFLQSAKKTNQLAVGKIIGKSNNPIMMRDGELLQSAFVTAHNPESKAEKELAREKLGLTQQITEEKEKQSAIKPKDDTKEAEAQAAAEAKVTAEEEKQVGLAQKKQKIKKKTTSDMQAQAQADSDANKTKVKPAPIESASGIPQGTGGGIPGLVNTLSQLLNDVAKDTTSQQILTALNNGIKYTGSGGKDGGGDGGEKKSLNIGADEALEKITAQVNADYPGAIRTGSLRANANSYSVDFWRGSVQAQKEAEKIQEKINKLEAEGKANTEGYNDLIQQRNSLLQKQEKITLRINKDTGEITSKVGIENFAVGANAAEKELQHTQSVLSQLQESNALQFNPNGGLTSQNQSINNWIQSMQALQVQRDKFASEGTLFDSKNQQVLNQMTAQTAQYRKEVMELLHVEGKFGGKIVDTFANPQTLAAQGEVYNKLLGIATATGKVKMETVKFNNETNTLSYTVETGKNQVQDMSLHMNSLNGAVSQQVIQTRHVDSAWQAFGKTLKGKWQEVARYLTTFGSIYRIWGMIKQGVNYVKEIDTALTELRKVTDATDKEYAQFLQTMSNTGAAVGATVKDLTSSAADWARLGYNLKQAGELAKNTAILMNVSEFEDVNKATDTLISSLQAFKKAGQDVGTFSMEIIDKYNEVGKIIAQIVW